MNSKWIKDRNVKMETTKLLEKNIGRTLLDKNRSKIFSDSPPKVTKIKIKKVTYLNLKAVHRK